LKYLKWKLESNKDIHLKLEADFFNAVKFADEAKTSTLYLMK
jgi:hypothetical protein